MASDGTTRLLGRLYRAGSVLEVGVTGLRVIDVDRADTLVARGWATRTSAPGPAVWLTITPSGSTAWRHVPLPR